MKRIISIFFLLISSIIYAEKIENYTIFVSLNEDKSVHIEEKIEYNPEEKVVHGLKRYIVNDNVGKTFGFNSKVGIKNFKSNFPFTLTKDENYDEYRLGEADKYLPQNTITTFKNSYDIYNIVRTNDNTTQIYLNVIGNYWNMSIEKAKIVLNFDDKAIQNLYVYTGNLYESGKNFVVKGKTIENKEILNEGEGITFKLNLDKSVYNFETNDKIKHIFKAYTSLIGNILIIVLLIAIMSAIIYLRFNLKDKRPIEPEFKVDDRISPSLASKVYSQNISSFKGGYAVLTVIFYSLLSKDLIVSKDRYEDNEYVLKKGEKLEVKFDYKESWTHEKDKIYKFVESNKIEQALNSNDILSPEEKVAVINLFKKREDLLSSKQILRETNEKANLYLNNIYKTNVGNRIVLPIVLSIFLIFASIINSILNSEFNVSILVVIAFSIINILLSSKLYNLKKSGKDIVRNLKGFIMYFDMTEKNIFKSFNTQEEMMQYAKKMLPYAIALGIRKKFITLLDKAISEKGYDRYYIYDGMYYGYLYNFDNISRKIYDGIRPKVENSNSSGGGFSSGSSGYSGGGFSGGGGSSW